VLKATKKKERKRESKFLEIKFCIGLLRKRERERESACNFLEKLG
jgi:hypothetical protein